MFAKLVALILSLGLIATVLLTVRHQRIRAVNEMAQISRRVAEHDRTLWKLRVEIASRVTPDRVYAMASRLGHLVPLAQPKWPTSQDRPDLVAAGPPPFDDSRPLLTTAPDSAIQPVSMPGQEPRP